MPKEHADNGRITKAEKMRLSERDSLLVLDLLENPPEPTAYLIRAAREAKINPVK